VATHEGASSMYELVSSFYPGDAPL
jgi:hypothetical protein